ncbi:MAG: radical SAM family heme chaperone HemW [Proteobacteria bacterium]|nr:radical SAM family heme chaperone HemW [Pseudomonadota bacterium]
MHVPFCKTKCPYCDFYSVTDLSLVDSWINALQKEMSFYNTQFPVFDSLYLGGGTPTLLSRLQIKQLLDALRNNFTFLPDTEITIEANPDDVTAGKLRALYANGVNRLSIGIQSFNEKELRFLKRRHTAYKAKEAVKIAKACGFTNIGIDLMYGYEGQTKENWLDTMKKAVELEPMHLSCYQFTLEETTPYGKLKKEGKLKSITEEEEREFFLLTSNFLRLNGFIHYEISNFGKGKKHFSYHNRKYWRHVPYLGLGPAAHSFKGNVRWWNCRSVEDYCQALSRGERPVEGSETLSPDQLRLERLYLGFRTNNGVSLDEISNSASTANALSQLTRSGFIKIRRGRIIPTLKGYLIADHLPLMFID